MPPPSTAPTGSITTTTTTERIANLLNLAQNLLCSVREQQQLTEKQIQRRHYRLQPTTPYQRPTGSANHAPGNGTANRKSSTNDSRASTSGNDGARGFGVFTNCGANTADGLQLDKTAFCSCVECLAHKLRREAIVTVPTVQVATAATDYVPRQYSGVNHNCSSNKSSSRVHQRNEGRHHRSSSRNNNADNDSINFQCSICLGSYRLRRPTATQCGHIFCRQCIMKCVSCQGKCPLCNCKLNSSNVFRVYF